MEKPIVFILLLGSVIMVALAGWVMNIYKLVVTAGPIAEFGALEVLRVVGIFLAPLGAVMGFM